MRMKGPFKTIQEALDYAHVELDDKVYSLHFVGTVGYFWELG